MRLYGKNPVLERIKSNPKSIRKIFIQEAHPEAAYLRLKAKKWNIPFFVIPKEKMHKFGQHHHSQGIMIEIDEFPYIEFGELLDTAVQKQTTLVFLDGLNDPQNLGGVIRSLACLGEFSIVLPKHGSVEVTEAVLRVASGGENHVSVSKVANLGNAISKAKDAGYWIAGTVVDGGQNLFDAKFSFPLAFVVGSEQKGIRDILRRYLDLEVTVPMAPTRMSLNVAHATAIFAYEITKQKNQT